MPNPEHVARLKEGSVAWNQWRDSNRAMAIVVKPDLRDADLSETDLREARLSHAELGYANLAYAKLQRAHCPHFFAHSILVVT